MLYINKDKSAIRHKIKLNLKKLTVEEKNLYSQQMQKLCIKFLINNNLFKHKNFACYIPLNNEINCINLIKFLLKHNNFCYLPRINEHTNNLDFFSYQLEDQLIKNKFGIYEPKFNLIKPIPIQKLDFFLLPILAFDLQGHRIGTGNGYYDRSLIVNNQKIHCPLIGLAYTMQQVDKFIKDPWDLDLDAIITEKYYCSFNNLYT